MGGVPGIEIAATPEKPAAQTSLPDRVMLESRQVG
jgi:hypothetical protein